MELRPDAYTHLCTWYLEMRFIARQTIQSSCAAYRFAFVYIKNLSCAAYYVTYMYVKKSSCAAYRFAYMHVETVYRAQSPLSFSAQCEYFLRIVEAGDGSSSTIRLIKGHCSF